MPLTTHLASELILQIFNFVDPPTLVSLACSCQFLEKVSRSLLRKHRDYHYRYRKVTDVDSQSLTTTMRSVMADPTLTWHVRELEFTSARTRWSHWCARETEGIPDSPDFAFTQDEQVILLDQLRDIFHFDEEEVDKARDDLQHGNDAPLKLLMFGTFPRVRSCKFTRHLREIGKGVLEREASSDPDVKPRSSFEYLHHAILICLRNKSLAWPAGLDSLEELYIGVDTGSQTTKQEFSPWPYPIANMMKLPHLISLYCFGLHIEDGPDDQHITNTSAQIEKGSSSVQHIFIDCVYGYDRISMEAIIAGCKYHKSLKVVDSHQPGLVIGRP